MTAMHDLTAITALPAPLVPSDVDLRGLQYMPLFGHHLFGSDFHAGCSDAEWRAGLTLWWAAWNQVPAASLPNDDVVLCRLAELGRDLRTWRKVRAKALHGFVACSDGRLYHKFLAEQALIAWDKRVKERDRKRKWRESRPVTEGEWRELRLAVFRRDGFKCVGCGATSDLEADHIIAVDQGGATALSNLQTLCKPCNARKGNGVPRRVPSGAFDADATGTEQGRDGLVPADGNRRDGTGREAEKDSPTPDGVGGAPAKPGPAAPRVPNVDHEAVVGAYHELLPDHPRVVQWTDSRQALLRKRWRELAVYDAKRGKAWPDTAAGVARFRKFFAFVGESRFLTGRTKATGDRPPFVADLEWLLRPTNFLKVVEGKFHAET
jgi:5-methylcytosine-specific restriction endonuclease McrA